MIDLKDFLKKDSHIIEDTGRTYTFCDKYTFHICSIKNFDLDEAFKGLKQGGLYCFTTEQNFDIQLQTGIYRKQHILHSLFYIGKTDDFSIRHFNNHEHVDNFRKLNISNSKMFIGLYICSTEQDPKEIESEILDAYNFVDNKQENKDKKDFPCTIQEN